MHFENIKNDVNIIFENHPIHDSLIDKIEMNNIYDKILLK